MKSVGGEAEISADVHEFQVAITQPAGAVVAPHADVVIHPECDIAAEVTRREDAEKAGLEVGGWNELWNGSRRRQSVEPVAVPIGHLEERVHAQPDGRQSRDLSRPNRLRPHILLRRGPQQNRRNLQERLVFLGKFETGILERLSEVIQLRKVDMTGAAGSLILTGKCWDRISAGRYQKERGRNQNPSRQQKLHRF